MQKRFNPRLKYSLIKSIGNEIYYKSHPLTRIELFQMALKEFFMWQIKTFGSRNKYNLHIIERNGFKNRKEYMDFWATNKGFKSYSEYNKKYKHQTVIKLKKEKRCFECRKNTENNSRCDECLLKHRERENKRYWRNKWLKKKL